MSEAERIWLEARPVPRGKGSWGHDRRRPSVGISNLLLALRDHAPERVGELARKAELNQGNVSRWLYKLEDRGFTRITDEVPGFGHHGGGKPARFWDLTPRGMLLANAIGNEREGQERYAGE